jgi:aromatic-amino-acid transaminase
VATIAADAALLGEWRAELEQMRQRVERLRGALRDALRATTGGGRFDFIAGQLGMFSLLGLPAAAVETLAKQHHIYMAPDSRINVAGLPEAQVGRVAAAIGSVLG